MAEIIIYSAPIHSGKTTRLKHWLLNKSKVFGFLTPDENDLRVIVDLATQKNYSWQTKTFQNEPTTEVGKYIFLNSGFDLMRQLLDAFETHPKGIFVIDEIGKLEIKGNGLEPELSNCLANFKERQDQSTMYIIVRDYLLEEVKLKYDLNYCKVVGHTYFE